MMSPSNNSNTKRVIGNKRRVAIQFSMCIVLFVWPYYRFSTISADMNLQARNDSVFGANNLDTSVKQVPCGQYKCFFRSKDNHDIGYLVAPSQRKKGTHFDWFETLLSGYNLSQQLQQQYDMNHFLLGPPTKEKVSSQLAKKLNKHLFDEKKARLMRGKGSSKFPKGSTIFVQKCKTAPKRSVVLGCVESKVDIFKRNMKNFVKDIKYTESFEQNFREGLATAKEILQSEPCLIKDFQVLVDEKGRFYHLDFDRCFKPDEPGSKYEISKEESQKCLQTLDDIDKRLQNKLSIL